MSRFQPHFLNLVAHLVGLFDICLGHQIVLTVRIHNFTYILSSSVLYFSNITNPSGKDEGYSMGSVQN